MAHSKVYHLDREKRDENGKKIFGWFDSCPKNAVFPEDYHVVAFVRSADLETIYRLTNNIDSNWTENEGVCAKRPELRSTSVGDIVVLPDGRKYLCAPAGWEEVS